MFFTKLLVWSICYPLAFVGFFTVTIFQCVSFLFHSPVDMWTMISESLEEAVEK